MSPEEQALAMIVQALDDANIPYMITGSVAASYHGRPRATHDTDIVIDPSPDQLAALVRQLAGQEFYVDDAGAQEALKQRRPFNVIEMTHACKVDLIVRRDRPFSIEEFRRRLTVDRGDGRLVSMVTAEDALLSKLEWARRAGDSERQLADAAGIVAVTPQIDRSYVERWAAELGVADLWARVSATGAVG
jgi:hypothetical protein